MRTDAVYPGWGCTFSLASGLPVFHNGVAGVGQSAGPTGGYLIGFIAAALIAGIAYEHESPYIHVIGFGIATVAIYVCGVSWLMYSARIDLYPLLPPVFCLLCRVISSKQQQHT